MRYIKSVLKGQSGFTIAEILIASLIISFSFAFIYLLITTAKEKSIEKSKNSALTLASMTAIHAITKEIRYEADKAETLPDGRIVFFAGERKWSFRFDKNTGFLYRDIYINDILAHSFFISDKVADFGVNLKSENKGVVKVKLKIADSKRSVVLSTSINIPNNVPKN